MERTPLPPLRAATAFQSDESTSSDQMIHLSSDGKGDGIRVEGLDSKSRKKTHNNEGRSRAKTSSACTACKARHAKCLPSPNPTERCARCEQHDLNCVYEKENDGRRRHIQKEDLERMEVEYGNLSTIVNAIKICPEQELAALLNVVRTQTSVDNIASYIRENAEGTFQRQKHREDEAYTQMDHGVSNARTAMDETDSTRKADGGEGAIPQPPPPPRRNGSSDSAMSILSLIS